jgi:ribose transport system permease protein
MQATGYAQRSEVSLFRRYVGSQESVVFLCAGLVFVFFGLTLDRFLTAGNLSNLLFNVSMLGILGCGMGVVVIGRGIDLSLVSIMAVGGGCMLQLLSNGAPIWLAFLVVTVLTALLGAVNGIIIAFIEVPALFATLATGLLFFGASRVLFLSSTVLYLPASYTSYIAIAQGRIFGVPIPVVIFAVVAFVLIALLKRTTFGQLLYAQGDNLQAARISGAPVRPMIVMEYMLSALAALVAGFIFTAASAAIDMQIVQSTLIFDVVLVVVLGGISLSGGRGSIWSVVAGTLLIGILLDGMIILDVNSNVQDVIKGVVLVAAILLDRFLHPVDEETAKQGDTL